MIFDPIFCSAPANRPCCSAQEVLTVTKNSPNLGLIRRTGLRSMVRPTSSESGSSICGKSLKPIGWGVFSTGPFSAARPGLSTEIDAALGNEAVVAWLTPEEIARVHEPCSRG